MGDTDTDQDEVTEVSVAEDEEDTLSGVDRTKSLPPPELKLKADPEDQRILAETTELGQLDWIEQAFDADYESARLNPRLSKFIQNGYGKLGRKLNQSLLSEGLSMIAKTISGLSHAFVKLDLPGRAVTDVSSLTNFKHLRYVMLPGNHILDIKPLNDLQFLMTLDISDNYIESLENFHIHQYLQVLNVSKNFLRTLKGVIEHPHLQRLYLSYNKLATFTISQQKCLKELETLELRKNRLKTFGESDLKLPALKVLFLAQNSIEDLKNLNCVMNLEFLDLRRNKIKAFGKWTTPSLKYLNLSWNYIDDNRELENLTGSLPALTTLVLTNNPVVKKLERLQKVIIFTCKKLTRFNDISINTQMRQDVAAALKEEEEEEVE